jgi:hypothetical protein
MWENIEEGAGPSSPKAPNMHAAAVSKEYLAPSPLGFLRSSLFAAAERASKEHVILELFTSKNCGITASYEGPRLTQQHAMVWQGLIREHARRCDGDIHSPLRIRQSDLLKSLGRTDTSTPARKWLSAKLKELQKGIVDLRTQKHHYTGQLVGEVVIDQRTGGYEICLPSRLATLLSDELALIDLNRKQTLGRNQLACWLHDFVSTQSNDRARPFPAEDLRKLSGSPLKIAQFRQALKAAACLLKTGENPLLSNARLDLSDRFWFEKQCPTKVIWIDERVNRKHEAQYAHEDGVEQALNRRGRVAL